MAMKNGDKYYEENVFPLIKEGKRKFNWYAFLFGFFWFPYKGMWKTWAMWYIPYIIVYAILERMGSTAVLGGSIGFAVGVGLQANKSYFKHYHDSKKDLGQGNVGYGIAGLVAYLAAFAFVENFVGGVATGYQQATATASGRSIASVPEITVPELMVDYQKYAGKKIAITGMLMPMGADKVGLSEEAGSMNTIMGDTSRLSREDKLRILNSCGSGCTAKLIVTPAQVFGQNGALVLGIVE